MIPSGIDSSEDPVRSLQTTILLTEISSSHPEVRNRIHYSMYTERRSASETAIEFALLSF